jgi:glycosyltransferase involved in cell wall biosynthesis
VIARPRLRILHVTPYYEEAVAYGGIPRVAAALSRGLARRGHSVTVWTTDARDAERRLEPPPDRPGPSAAWSAKGPDGVEMRVFPNASNRLAYRRQLFLPRGLRALARLEAGRFDIAHIHGHRHVPGALAAAALARAGVPYVVEPHGAATFSGGPRLAKRLFDATLGRGVLEGARRVLAVSRVERARLDAAGLPEAKLRIVPNPISLEQAGGEADAGSPPIRRPGDPARIAFLGTLQPAKEVDVLVRAVARIDGARLIVAGNDLGGKPAIRAAVRAAGLDDRVHFEGLVTGRARRDLLASADVFAYPGRAEVFGLAALEALLCGTPAVVAAGSGCGEVVAEVGGGRLVPPGDPVALASALEALVHERRERPAALAAELARARDRIAARFSPDVAAAAIEAVYEEVLGPAGARAPCPA